MKKYEGNLGAVTLLASLNIRRPLEVATVGGEVHKLLLVESGTRFVSEEGKTKIRELVVSGIRSVKFSDGRFSDGPPVVVELDTPFVLDLFTVLTIGEIGE